MSFRANNFSLSISPRFLPLIFIWSDEKLRKFFVSFDLEKLAEATRKYATLVAEMSSSMTSHYNAKAKKKLPARKLQELKLAFSEFYLSLILLQNYQNLNFTGFRKILKKHDKVSVLCYLNYSVKEFVTAAGGSVCTYKKFDVF